MPNHQSPQILTASCCMPLFWVVILSKRRCLFEITFYVQIDYVVFFKIWTEGSSVRELVFGMYSHFLTYMLVMHV